jgi:hypothetical protein
MRDLRQQLWERRTWKGTAATLAQRFHELFEEYAPRFGDETRTASRGPWTDLAPPQKALLEEVFGQILREVLRGDHG